MDPTAPSTTARATRLASLDLIRGVAVLGILLLNILSFGMPQAAYLNPRAWGGWHGADLATWAVNFIFFDGRMRGLFSFLFGASMLLVIERAEANGESAASVHYRRMAWLLVFGLAHLWLVWEGDILAHYALMGMFAFALRDLPVERMMGLGVALILATTVIFAGLPWTVQAGHELQALTQMMGVPSARDIAAELAQHRGDYAGILRARLTDHATTPLVMLWFYGPETLAYMLFGMAGLKSGMLRGEWTSERYRRWLLVCWGVTLPCYLALAAYQIAAQFSLFSVALGSWALTVPLRPPMIAGWACLILLLARPGGPLTTRLGAAGRMAFTNYLATSLIATTLFYGYGLGWFGHLSRWQLYLVVAVIWAAILLWSKPWLDRFRFGPFEWLWRSLARGVGSDCAARTPYNCECLAIPLRIGLNSRTSRSSRREGQMVVCVCNAIRENDVRAAAREGATSACQAYRALGRSPKCGQCVPFAREIINAERAAA